MSCLVIVSPANDLQALADYIEAQRRPGAKRPMFASVHRRGVTEVHASDLTLDKFQEAATQTAAPTLPGPSAEVHTVLLTGATGFLGRYLALEWLERLSLVDGKVVRRPLDGHLTRSEIRAGRTQYDPPGSTAARAASRCRSE